MTLLRPARIDDAPFIAGVLLSASRGHLPRGPWDLALPDAIERDAVLARVASGAERSWCHQSVFHVAEVDGVTGSALCSFRADADDEPALRAAVAAAFAAARIGPERLAAVVPVFATFSRCIPPFEPGAWIVENVGTRPALRRRGLVARLLDDALERGRRAGCTTAQISCLLGNDPAQLAYESAGFRVVEERKDPAFEELLGTPGFSRMTVSL
jgi:translation initiation factor 4G